jgi:hypothetical protein
MAVSVAKGQTSSAEHRSSRLQEMAWNEIYKPGCYLILGSVDLVRVPQDALAPGHSPLITITSSGETHVAKLSENPAEPISVLRSVAADNDYFVNFCSVAHLVEPGRRIVPAMRRPPRQSEPR